MTRIVTIGGSRNRTYSPRSLSYRPTNLSRENRLSDAWWAVAGPHSHPDSAGRVNPHRFRSWRHRAMKPNAPEKEVIAGVECFVYPAGQYAAVDADVADERKDGRSAAVVAREMSKWAGIRSAENLRWMLDELLTDRNRASAEAGKVERALKALLFALHARPMPGYPLLDVETAIADALKVLER